MSSTNKTPNYDLSQYVGTDKPTYLGDYNGDMLKIDTQMKENENSATNAISQAGQATAKVTELEGKITGLEGKITGFSDSVSELTDEVDTLKNSVSQNTSDITSINSRLATLEQSATLFRNNIDDINNRLNAQWINSGNVINTAIPSLLLANSFLHVGYNKLTQQLSVYFYVEKTAESPVSNGQVIGTIPQNIMSLLNITAPRTFVNGCDYSYLAGDIYYNVGKNLKLDTNGQISIIGDTKNTAYIQTNLMLNTSAWT